MEIIKGIFVVVMVVALVALILGLPVMLLWNWLMPEIFGLPLITFWQGVGINILSSILFKTTYTSKK